MESSKSIRNIKEEMFTIKASEFNTWYESLTEAEKNTYRIILEEVENEKSNSNTRKI
jgi:hypothetical protein